MTQHVGHQSFGTRTTSFSREERTALATRSLSAVNRLSGDARRDALNRLSALFEN